MHILGTNPDWWSDAEGLHRWWASVHLAPNGEAYASIIPIDCMVIVLIILRKLNLRARRMDRRAILAEGGQAPILPTSGHMVLAQDRQAKVATGRARHATDRTAASVGRPRSPSCQFSVVSGLTFLGGILGGIRAG